MINHHPSSDRLTAFSAGSLPLSQALCISAHIEHCPQCRRDVKLLNQVGSELLSQLDPVAVPESLKSRVMDAINSPEAVTGTGIDSASHTTEQLQSSAQTPRCLRKLIPNGLSELNWKRLSPSIHATKLCSDVNGSKIEMIKIQPGGQVASHNHTGEEITVVLSGSFSDDSGIYRKGDIIFRNKEDKHHRPIASQDSECICLTSVEAPIQFTGFFARLFNPLIRRSHYAS
jgi:putative transcriptional regulator